MGFFKEFEKLNICELETRLASATRKNVEQILSKEYFGPEDFPILFSKAATPYLEELAVRSAAVTQRRFGKVIQLYAPLYLSNECVNHCVYCGFSKENDIVRVTLPVEKVLQESEILYNEGFRHILLVSGESPRAVGFHYLTNIIKKLHENFASISLEIYPLDQDGYKRMGEAGADGLTCYQESYLPSIYKEIHPKGPKRNFAARLDSQDHAGQAGYRSLGIGALLGLSNWRIEAVLMAHHGVYLTKKYWQSRIGLSFPRIRNASGGFFPPFSVSDTDLVHMMSVLRLILPDSEMVISTREQAEFRDNIISLGVTRMSAGSKTNPGGYLDEQPAGGQFTIKDSRTAKEVARVIFDKGYEPVWKDFDGQFIG